VLKAIPEKRVLLVINDCDDPYANDFLLTRWNGGCFKVEEGSPLPLMTALLGRG
jgi:hypothetical protein